MDGWADRQTDEWKSPCVLHDFVLFKGAALLPLTPNHNYAKHGYGYCWPHIAISPNTKPFWSHWSLPQSHAYIHQLRGIGYSWPSIAIATFQTSTQNPSFHVQSSLLWTESMVNDRSRFDYPKAGPQSKLPAHDGRVLLLSLRHAWIS